MNSEIMELTTEIFSKDSDLSIFTIKLIIIQQKDNEYLS